jgi:hypothetical protein
LTANVDVFQSAVGVLSFGVISAILMIVDASTGGQLKFNTPDNTTHYGTWNPNGLFPIYIISGVAYGMVELIRRVIPRDIVGGDVQRVSLAFIYEADDFPLTLTLLFFLNSSVKWTHSSTSCTKLPAPPALSPRPV